jgi:16S rRNA (cytidine1402-2'-O)-methyltransferase
VETLQAVDFIAAEDTRVTLKILNHFGIKKPQVSYYEHNLREKGEQIIQRIQAGENCAIVTDAGMPCISDPGEDLVRLCAEQGIPVAAVPGPSALITALAVSGLPTARFAFEGFLSMNRKRRMERLEQIRKDDRTLIFYEAPHKLRDTLKDLLEGLGNRRISLCRELTKVYEEIRRTTIEESILFYNKEENKPKGEFVLVVEGASLDTGEEAMTFEQAVQLAQNLRDEGIPPSEAAKQAAKLSKQKKNDIYRAMSVSGHSTAP